MSRSRSVFEQVFSEEQSEGVGARVRRSIGRLRKNGTMVRIDPFLMLDEFSVSPPAGFPDHPHRGFETVTYMLEGSFMHEDFCGHAGTINSGDLQWMTAGRGIVHSEMPNPEYSGRSHGLQLWVNLSSAEKFCEPLYQELKKENIPSITENGVTAIVIAGEAMGVLSPVYTRTPCHYIHFKMEPGTILHHRIPQGFNSFMYILNGQALIGENDELCDAHFTVVLNQEGEGISVKASQDQGCDFVLLAGQPLNEPVVSRGPFVLNTEHQLYQAFRDYQTNKNGFENAKDWYSQIGLPLTHADQG